MISRKGGDNGLFGFFVFRFIISNQFAQSFDLIKTTFHVLAMKVRKMFAFIGSLFENQFFSLIHRKNSLYKSFLS